MVGSTVKVTVPAAAAEVEAPEAPMGWVPPLEAGRVKLAVQFPWGLAVTLEATVALSKVTLMPVSPGEKPAPVTVTAVPGGPLLLLVEKPALTVKFWESP
jgi:hypothetical protein